MRRGKRSSKHFVKIIVSYSAMADDVLGVAAWAGALERHAYINAQGHEPTYNPAADWDARAWKKAWQECKQRGADALECEACQREFYDALFGQGKWDDD
jgi:hypothetical protein